MGVTPWPAPAKKIKETPDTLARGGVMEPAARTVASGPEWPMRAGGQQGVNGQPLGTHGAAAAAQASDRLLQGRGASCPRAAEGTARGSWAGLWDRLVVYIPGGWARPGPLRFPMPPGVRVE